MTKQQRYEEMYRLLEFMYEQFEPSPHGSFRFVDQGSDMIEEVSPEVYDALCQIEDVLYLDDEDDEFDDNEEF